MWSSRQWLFALKASVTAIVAIHALLAAASLGPFGDAVPLWKSSQSPIGPTTVPLPAEGTLERRGGESNAPLRAALHDSLAQRNQLWALMTGNESLAPGWSLKRDPHQMLSPFLRAYMNDSMDHALPTSFDPYRETLESVPQMVLIPPELLVTQNDTDKGKINKMLQFFDWTTVLNASPLPARAYRQTIAGYWKTKHWKLRSDFIAYFSDGGGSANDQDTPASKNPVDQLGGGTRAKVMRRQADFLTLLFGTDYPGRNKDEALGLYPTEIEGGEIGLTLRETVLFPGNLYQRTKALSGDLTIWPAEKSSRALKSSIRRRSWLPKLRRQEANNEQKPELTPADKERLELEEDDKMAMDQYRSMFLYDAAKEKTTEPIAFDLDGLHFLQQGLLYAQALPVESPEYTDPSVVLSMIPLPHKAQLPPAPDVAELTGGNAPAAVRKMTELEMELAAWILLNDTFIALNETLNNRVIRNNASIQVGGSREYDTRTARHNCTFHLYAHVKPSGSFDQQQQVLEWEAEMRNPSGISTISPPPAELEGMLFSPNCFLVMKFDTARGSLFISRQSHAIRYAMSLIVVLTIQCFLVTRQMDLSMTPSAISKISSVSWSLQCLIDIGTFGMHVVLGIFENNRSSRALMAAAFLAATLFIALQYQHTLTMWHVQAPEFRITDAQRAAAAAPAAGDGTSTTAAAGTETPPVATTPTNRARETLARVRSGIFQRPLVPALFAFLIFSIVRPDVVGNVVLFLCYSFWVPQIWRNMSRGTRKAVERRYVAGMSLCRFFLPAYFFGCPNNFADLDTNYGIVLLAFLWLTLQASILIGQSLFGTHFFVPLSMRPKNLSWEWHPPIESLPAKLDAESGQMSVGDCSVCLSAILPGGQDGQDRQQEEVEVAARAAEEYELQGHEDEPERQGLLASSGEAAASRSTSDLRLPSTPSSPAQPTAMQSTWTSRLRSITQPLLRRLPRTMQISARHEVMVTPCRHIFHTACLEQWLNVKTECPSCRAILPPV